MLEIHPFSTSMIMGGRVIFQGLALQGHSQLPSLPQAAVSAFELPAAVPNQDGEPSKGHTTAVVEDRPLHQL